MQIKPMGRQAPKHNMIEHRRYEDQKKEVASQIREKRFFMMLTQKEVYDALQMNPGQYTRIEQGELDGSKVIKYIDELFEEWKKKELKRLKARIAYIEAL
jgi:hypothetical protein